MTSNAISATNATLQEERALLPLLSLAENCAYSAKNHLKSADVMIVPRYLINIITTLSLFAIAIPYLQAFPLELQTIAVVASALNLLLVVGLLSSERESEYKKIGDSYLELYRDCFELYTSNQTVSEKRTCAEKLQDKYDKHKREHIGLIARKLSKRSLEHADPNDDELDLIWLKNEKRRLTHG